MKSAKTSVTITCDYPGFASFDVQTNTSRFKGSGKTDNGHDPKIMFLLSEERERDLQYLGTLVS